MCWKNFFLLRPCMYNSLKWTEKNLIISCVMSPELLHNFRFFIALYHRPCTCKYIYPWKLISKLSVIHFSRLLLDLKRGSFTPRGTSPLPKSPLGGLIPSGRSSLLSFNSAGEYGDCQVLQAGLWREWVHGERVSVLEFGQWSNVSDAIWAFYMQLFLNYW